MPSGDLTRDPEPLPQWATDAFERFDVAELRDEIVCQCVETVFPDRSDDEPFVAALSDSISENVRAMRLVLTGSLPPAETSMAQRLRFASVEARSSISHASLERSYRISFHLQQTAWYMELRRASSAHAIAVDDVLDAVATLQRLIHVYADAVMQSVAAGFAESDDALNRSRSHLRQRLVKDLLAGTEQAWTAADLAMLEYPLSHHHIAVFLPDTPQEQAERLASKLRRGCGARRSLVYGPSLSSAVVWIAASAPWSSEAVSSLVELLHSVGVGASISTSEAGPNGLRKTLAQARQVEGIRRADAGDGSSSVVAYEQVRLELLLVQDPPLAEEFVRRELGPLAADSSEAVRLRQTLEASLRLGSHVGAAAELGLHEHTVRNRLQRVQELLGPVHDRRTEVHVALRLYRLLHSPPSSVLPAIQQQEETP